MKQMTGRFLKKLKFFPSLTNTKHGSISQLNSSENLLDQNMSNRNICDPSEAVADGNVRFSKDISEDFEKEEELESEFHVLNMKNTKTSTTLGDFNARLASVVEEEYLDFSDFENRCPPGGVDSVILYTTSLRSIRKTFEDCQAIKFLLQSFKVVYDERDVSMQLEFRDELWGVMGKRVIPPRLFIKGRYIGGADEVIMLHEQGKLKKLLTGIPVALSSGPCSGCGNICFLVCATCNGSRKVFIDTKGHGAFVRCAECNENGLVKCSICS